MRDIRSPFLWVFVAIAFGVGLAVSAPDPVMSVYAEIEQPRANNSTQPVDVMNWLIDENGNLRVSNQVRTKFLKLNEGVTSIEQGGVWYSDAFNVAEFQAVFAVLGHVDDGNASPTCWMYFRWDSSMPWVVSSSANRVGTQQMNLEEIGSVSSFAVEGREARVKCRPSSGSASVDTLHILLRAE